MTRLLTNEIATMTELREPQKVLDRAKGKPVAILKNSKLVGYLVSAESVATDHPSGIATPDEVIASLTKRRAVNAPVLEYLKDK